MAVDCTIAGLDGVVAGHAFRMDGAGSGRMLCQPPLKVFDRHIEDWLEMAPLTDVAAAG